MIQAIIPSEQSYEQIESLKGLQEWHIRDHNLGSQVDRFARLAKGFLVSFSSPQISETTRNLSSLHDQRMVTICEPPPYEALGRQLDQTINQKIFDSTVWIKFVELLNIVNYLIGYRKELSPKRQEESLKKGNQEFIANGTSKVDCSIKHLASAVKLWTKNLSAETKNHIEHFIRTNEQLTELKKVYDQKIPEFVSTLRVMFGLDKNTDGSPRVKTQAPPILETKPKQTVTITHKGKKDYTITISNGNRPPSIIKAKLVDQLQHNMIRLRWDLNGQMIVGDFFAPKKRNKN